MFEHGAPAASRSPGNGRTAIQQMALSLGIIGAGSIGTVHALAAVRNAMRVAAVWDIDCPKAATLAAKAPGARAACDLDDLLADPRVNAVIVATPNDTHAEIACRAIAAGKHVLLEKPMATSLAECDAIMAALARAKVRLQMGFVYRNAPAPRAVKAEIEAGRFGRIYHAKCSMYRRRGIPGLGGWFTTRARSGGGPLIDLGVHVIDQVLWLCGHPRAMRASGATYATFGPRMRDYVFEEMWAGPPRFDGVFDVEDHASALVRFEGGMTVELNVTWAGNIPDRQLPDGVTLFGERAGCRFTLLGDEVVIATEAGDTLVDRRLEFDATRALDRAFEDQLRSLERSVDGRSAPAASAADGRAVQAIIDAIDRSSRAQCEVEVDSRR